MNGPVRLDAVADDTTATGFTRGSERLGGTLETIDGVAGDRRAPLSYGKAESMRALKLR